MRGKWCPLETICVPMSTCASPRASRSRMAAAPPGRRAVSRSSTATFASGKSSAKRSSTRSVPAPMGSSAAASHTGQKAGGARPGDLLAQAQREEHLAGALRARLLTEVDEDPLGQLALADALREQER